jgi:hypothetical protein
MRFETITPEKAQKYLENMAPNRRLVRTHIEYLAKQIRDGLWVEGAGDPIRFGLNGQLCDGQHRLRAVLETGINLQCAVIRNVPAKAMPVIDTGRRRNLADFLSMQGEPYPSVLAAAILQVGSYLKTREFGSPRGLKSPIQASMDLLAAHPGLRQSVPATTIVAGLLGGGQGMWTAIHYVLSLNNYDDAAVFFDRLATGQGFTAGDPVGLLRNRLITERNSRTKMDQRTLSAYILKAWQLYCKGTKIEVLSWRGGGANPENYPIIEAAGEQGPNTEAVDQLRHKEG